MDIFGSGVDFVHDYVMQNRPVLIDNFQTNWWEQSKGMHCTVRCVITSSHTNSLIYIYIGTSASPTFVYDLLKNMFEFQPVRVSVSPSGRFDGPEDGSLWGLPGGREVLVRCVKDTLNKPTIFNYYLICAQFKPVLPLRSWICTLSCI